MGMIGDAKIMLNQKLMPGGSNIDLVYKAVHKCKNIADKLQIEDMTDIKKQIINSLVDEYGFGALDLMVELNDYEGINFAFGKTKFKGKNTNEILTEYPELAVSIIRSKGYEPIGILDEISRIKQTPDNPKIIFEKGTYIYHVHDIQNTCPINNKEINECKKQNIKFNRGYKITNVDRGSGSFELDGLLGKFKPSDFTHYHVPK